MIWAINYDAKPTLTKADFGALMTEFGTRGELPGTICHYAFVGGGGIVIVDQDDPAAVYAAILAYTEWLDFDVRAALPTDDTTPMIMSYLGA